MDSFALTIIIVSAFVHVIPHLAIKGAATDRDAFVWWMLAANAVLYVPVLALGDVPRAAWPFIIGSGIVEAIYIFVISRAYASGDVSLVYPLARGSAPVFLLAFATFVLHEPLTIAGIAGVLLIAIGVLWGRRFALDAASLWSLLAGILTATYTTIDKAGVRLMNPLTYIYLTLFVTFLVYTPFMRWTSIRATLASARWRILVAGAAMPLAYALVLVAMRRGALASYAGAVREVSIVVAAIAGAMFFRERVGTARIVGAITIVAGVVLIALHG
ncbi:MAG TPA: EamA family transporter [Thermoanaerobaculia bacterium]|nr:EamA family transporter [Thermoanaerobaculia bacterium]